MQTIYQSMTERCCRTHGYHTYAEHFFPTSSVIATDLNINIDNFLQQGSHRINRMLRLLRCWECMGAKKHDNIIMNGRWKIMGTDYIRPTSPFQELLSDLASSCQRSQTTQLQMQNDVKHEL